MIEETYRLEVDSGKTTTVKASRPEKGSWRGGVVLAHGMANDLDHPVLAATAGHLAERDFLAMRFNFLYREAGRDRADSEKVLLATFNRVCEDALARWSLEPDRLVVGGKSLGARIGTLAVTKGLAAAGLLYLGFPLHPPGRPELIREELILSAGLPQFFVAGDRDFLCPLDRLREVIEKTSPKAGLHVIEGGDHSFVLPAGSGRAPEEVNLEAARASGDWLEGILV